MLKQAKTRINVKGSLTLTGMETLRLSLFEVFANAKRDLAEAKL